MRIRNEKKYEDIVTINKYKCGHFLTIPEINKRKYNIDWEYICVNITSDHVYLKEGTPELYDGKIKKDGRYTFGVGGLDYLNSDKYIIADVKYNENKLIIKLKEN